MKRAGETYMRFVTRKPLTPARAAWAIAAATAAMTTLCGIAIRFVDHQDFDNVWLGLWWAVQTVTTVGYGDIVPKPAAARILASVLMLGGIAFVTVVTAVITAAFLESVRRRLGDPAQEQVIAKLDQLAARLDEIESAVRR